MDEFIVKYTTKDVIFNNGIINLYKFLRDRDYDLELELNSSSLVLKMDSKKSEEIYFQILEEFFKEYKIVYQTKNDRWYFDEKKQDFILDKKFDTVGGQKNDLRNGVYLYKNISEFGLDREYVEGLYLRFCEKYNQKIEQEKNGKLKVPNRKNEVIVAITLDEAVERFTKYFVKGNILTIDSKIHSFEDGQGTFHSMLKQPKNYKIDKWNALIYWFGSRVQRFYNYSYFIYPNSSNLLALNSFKEYLKISDDSIEVRDDKGNIKTLGTNIDFFNQLSRDEITNKNFYISKSEEEFEVKFFMYLFSIIYHIEEQYQKATKKRKVTREKLYRALQEISFVVYTDDGTFKTSFNEYTKAYLLIKFFELLKEKELFAYLSDILLTFSMSQDSKEVNLNLKSFCQNILEFSNLRKNYYLTSFNILKKNSKFFGKRLFEFEKLYLEKILKGKDMNIHEKSKKLGDGIGYYCAELGDKDLLFRLRSIKNYKQLIAYFRDLKFSILKNEDKAKFSKEFNEALSEILEEIEPNWELVRDYVAIYAIDKYRAVNFAKNGGDK
ncbi:MAG: hypothetical protein GXO60_06595 [Epsilonproteobacteria bacterium]|nr:hypothetical protein [Campylobacterota bacterium]